MKLVTDNSSDDRQVAWKQKVFLFLVSVVAVTLPFKAIYNSVACLVLFMFWLTSMPKYLGRPRLVAVALQSVLLWLALLGMLYTSDLEEGWFRTQQKALLLLLPLTIGTADIPVRLLHRWSLSAFVLATLAACLFCLVDGFRWWWLHNSTERFFAHGLVEQIDLYTYIMALLCLVSIVFLTASLQKKLELVPLLSNRHLVIFLLIFFTAFIFLLSVKQVVIAWFLLTLVGGWQWVPGKLRWAVVGGAILILVLATWLVPAWQEKVREVMDRDRIQLDQDSSLGRNWNGIALREAIWACAWDAIRQRPWLGAGTGDGQQALQEAYEARKFYFASRYNRFNAHNQYLQTGVVHGIPGLTMWVLALGMLFYLNRSNSVFTVVLGCLCFCMLTESMMETNKGVLLVAFIVSVLSIPVNNTSQEPSEHKHALNRGEYGR